MSKKIEGDSDKPRGWALKGRHKPSPLEAAIEALGVGDRKRVRKRIEKKSRKRSRAVKRWRKDRRIAARLEREARETSEDRQVRERSARWRIFTKRRVWAVDQVIAVMEPGCWYGTPELVAAFRGEIPKDGVCEAMSRYNRRRDFLERAKNPAWKPELDRQYVYVLKARHWRWKDTRGLPLPPETIEPRWVYRLTPAGERHAASVRRRINSLPIVAARYEAGTSLEPVPYDPRYGDRRGTGKPVSGSR